MNDHLLFVGFFVCIRYSQPFTVYLPSIGGFLQTAFLLSGGGSTMSILKKRVNSDFTCVHNTFIKDKSLSIASKGLLLVMLSLARKLEFLDRRIAGVSSRR